MTTEFRTSRLSGIRPYLERRTVAALLFKFTLVQVGLINLLACGRGTWGDSGNLPSCKDDLLPRDERCMPTIQDGLDALGENCARSLDDEGAELEIEGRCAWVVCINADEVGSTCHSTKSSDLSQIERLIDTRFSLLNSSSQMDIGFTLPLAFGPLCRASQPIDGQCCYVVPVTERCDETENADE